VIGLGPVIGVGWITGVGIWISQSGSVGAVLAFLVGGLAVLLVGLCYAEMCSISSNSGGEIAYAKQAFGQGGAFAAGWMLVLIYIAATAFEGISFGWVVSAFAPSVREHVVYRAFGQPVSQVALLSGACGLALVASINFTGSRAVSRFQRISTYTKLALAISVIVLGVNFGRTHHLDPAFVSDDARTAFSGCLLVVLTTPFWLAGFNTVTQAFSERSRAVTARQMAGVVLCTIGVATLFYCLVIIAVSMSMSRGELLSMDLPGAGALDALLGRGAGRIALSAGLFGLFSAWNALFFAQTRVLADLSRRGFMPSFLNLHSAHERAPRSAVVACAVLGALGVACGKGAIVPILDAASACVAAVFALVAACVIVLRWRQRDLHRPFKVPCGTAVAATACVLSCGLFALSVRQSFAQDSKGFPVVTGILTVWPLLGVVLYAFRRKSVCAIEAQPGAASLGEPGTQ